MGSFCPPAGIGTAFMMDTVAKGAVDKFMMLKSIREASLLYREQYIQTRPLRPRVEEPDIDLSDVIEH